MDQDTFDQGFLSQCLDLAREAEKVEEVPVGAIVVNNQTGEVVAKAYNLRESLNTPIGHAEIMAIHKACKKLGTWRLTGHTLYSSLEPCVMCAGAIVAARIPRVVFGAWDEKVGAAGSAYDILRDARLGKPIEVIPEVLGDKCQKILKDFFEAKR